MPKLENAARSAMSVFFEYDTPRIVHIRSKKVGLINRTLQLGIIGYIIGFAIIYNKGYQEFEIVKSAVTSKLKGIVFSNSSIPGIGTRTWDVADYVIPPQENNAFFVMTNVVVTPGQTQTTCPESFKVVGANCTTNSDCEQIQGMILPDGNGPVTGECVPNSSGEGINTCQVFAWCPLENDNVKSKTPVLFGARNFTVFIKNSVEFPKFDISRRNILGVYNDSELANCRWNGDHPMDKFCPIFILDDIAKAAGTSFDEMTLKGAVMQIVIDWTCNLDFSVDECTPEYSFVRLDRANETVSPGFNFRYSDQYSLYNESTQAMTLYRNLYKAYGVRFVITVQGTAGKFSLFPLVLNIGSGLAMLSIATIICDIIVLYILKARNFFKQKKYLDVTADDAFQRMQALHEDTPNYGSDGSNGNTKRRSPSQPSDGGASS